MSALPSSLRKPSFLEGLSTKDVSLADFVRTTPPPPVPSHAPLPPLPSLPPAPPSPPTVAAAFPAGLAELAPPPTPPRPAFVPDALIERFTHSIEAMKFQSSQLAEQARTDALEIGLLVAERILEQELSTNPRALISLVRTAMRRLSESRTMTVFLSPGDADRVNERVRAQDPDVSSLATVKISADASLEPGDCRIESELGSVDGKLSTRMNEIRRSLEAP